MTKKRRLGIAIVVGALVSVALPGLAAADPGDAASGSGHFIDEGELRTFSFTVREMPDGSVRGQAQVNKRSQPASAWYRLDCLDVIGDTAYFGGTIWKATNAGNVGTEVSFKVVDNGEGAAAPPDTITTAGPYVPCDDGASQALLDGLPQFAIESGNIQVD